MALAEAGKRSYRALPRICADIESRTGSFTMEVEDAKELELSNAGLRYSLKICSFPGRSPAEKTIMSAFTIDGKKTVFRGLRRSRLTDVAVQKPRWWQCYRTGDGRRTEGPGLQRRVHESWLGADTPDNETFSSSPILRL